MNQNIPLQPEIFFVQIGYVLGGLFLLLLGTAIFYTIAYWWLKGQQVGGVIMGVRRRGPQFHSVYRYALPNGELREATSVQGGNSLKGRETGRRVDIRIVPGHPEEASESPGPAIWALAFGLFLGGAWLTYDSVTTWKRSPVTWILVILFAVLVGRKVWRWLTRFLTKMQSRIGAPDPWASFPIEAAETLGSAPQPGRFQVRSSNTGRSSTIFCVAGLVVIGTAMLPARQLLQLRKGTRTEGTVLRLDSNQSVNNHYSLFPEVQFTNTEGAILLFSDRTGSNPSPYKVGDHVTVLYLPGKQNTAMIDRGLRMWEPVVGLLLLGTVMTSLGFLTLRSRLESPHQGNLMGLPTHVSVAGKLREE